MQQDARFAEVIAIAPPGVSRRRESSCSRSGTNCSARMDCCSRPFSPTWTCSPGTCQGRRHSAEKLLRETDSAPIRATAYRILAEACANRLEFEDSLAHYAAARALCRAGVPNTLSANVELSFWGWFAGVLPLESSEAEFASVRKAVARSAHPHHVAELRLCAARVEARKGFLMEARRHWATRSATHHEPSESEARIAASA